jgi:hypothetical protein
MPVVTGIVLCLTVRLVGRWGGSSHLMFHVL